MTYTTANFSKSEWLYMLDAINGVKCQPYTLVANLKAHSEFMAMPVRLDAKLDNLDAPQLIDLYQKLYAFWDVQDYSIPNTEDRMREVGISWVG